MPKYSFKITITECVDRETTIDVESSSMTGAYQLAEQEIVQHLHNFDWHTKNNTVKISDFQIDFVEKNGDISGDQTKSQ